MAEGAGAVGLVPQDWGQHGLEVQFYCRSTPKTGHSPGIPLQNGGYGAKIGLETAPAHVRVLDGADAELIIRRKNR